jgi:hypothetical protein
MNSTRYQTNNHRYEIEKLVKDLRQRIFKFEISTLKTKDILAELCDYNKQIKGFNLWLFLLGFCSYHTIYIFYTKRLLYEHKALEYIRHLMLSSASGIAFGLLGYRYSYDLGLYRHLKRSQRNIEKIRNDFEYYYILNKEEEFEE